MFSINVFLSHFMGVWWWPTDGVIALLSERSWAQYISRMWIIFEQDTLYTQPIVLIKIMEAETPNVISKLLLLNLTEHFSILV